MLWNALDVETALGRPLTTAEANRLHAGMGASREAELVAYLRRPVGAASVTGETYWAGQPAYVLASSPVQSVTEVRVDGTVVPVADWVAYPWGVELRSPLLAITSTSRIAFDYVGGLSDLDEHAETTCRSVLCGRLARELRIAATGYGPEVQRLSVEGFGIDFAGGVKGTAGWNDDERGLLDRYRRRSFR